MRRLPPRPTAKGAFFDYLREIHAYLEATAPMPGQGTRLSFTTRGAVIDAVSRGDDSGGEGGGDSVVEIGRFSVSQVLRNVLLCYRVTGASVGTTLIPVAKPFELDPDRAIGDGALTPIYVYPPSNGTASEIAATYRWRTSQLSKESIFPAYGLSGRSIIFAMKGITGGSGVSYNGSTVEWQDMNVDGRIFLTDLNTYTVCVQGAYKTVQIRGTNPNA